MVELVDSGQLSVFNPESCAVTLLGFYSFCSKYSPEQHTFSLHPFFFLFEQVFLEWQVARRETLLPNDDDASKADNDLGHNCNLSEERAGYSGDLLADQATTLAIHEKPPAESSFFMLSSQTQGSRSGKLSEQEHKSEHEEVLANGDLASPKSKRKDALSGTGDGKEDAVHKMNNLFSFGTRNQDKNLLKVRLFAFSSYSYPACLPR